MQKSIYTVVCTVFLMFTSVLSVFAFGGATGMSGPLSSEPVVTEQMQELTVPLRFQGAVRTQHIPLFSEQYADTAIAMVNGEPITMKEFAMELASMHSSIEDSASKGKQDYARTLDRLIAVKLVKQEALNIGFDRTPSVQVQIENFVLKTMIQQLLAEQVKEVTVDESAVEELYQQMAIEVKLLTYKIFSQADAEAMLEDVRAGGDFSQLAGELVSAGKAEESGTAEYIRLNDLLPAVAQAVYDMEAGEVSEIFKVDDGFMTFRLEDQRVYEDPDARLAAASRLLQKESRKKQLEYLQSLEDKYATFDEEAEKTLDFVEIMAKTPEATGTEVFARLGADKRPLVTISNGQETVVITVADVSDKLKASMYHGSDKVIDGEEMNAQKDTVLWNKLVAVTGRMEAQSLGVDTSEVFLEKRADFEERLLFDTFMTKAVVPGITVREEDVRAYYDSHQEEFSSPLMLKMNSLVFSNASDAREALRKLQAGSDFKWVSANSTGLADPDHKDLLALGDKLLATTALPETLHEQVHHARQGDVFLYEGPADLYYTLQVDSAYPPVAKPYDDVRDEIGRILYAEKINEALADWVSKLKEAYETENYLVQEPM